MSTRDALLEQVVETFLAREEQHLPIAQVTAIAPDVSEDEAYEIQSRIIAKLIKREGGLLGKKIGATSAAAQKMLNVPEPIYGVLLASRRIPNGGTMDASKWIRPVMECEITFRLKSDIKGPNVTADDVLAATAGVSASLEIADLRSKPDQGWSIGMPEAISYNAFARTYVISDEVVPVAGLDLRTVRVTLKKNGEAIQEANGTAVLGNPPAAVAWAANKLATHGKHFSAGDVILSGAFNAPPPISPGDHFEAIFEPLGIVSARFV